jgi:hypothetical protein
MRVLLLTLTTCMLALPAFAKYSGGTGEPNDPYQIATADDLITLGETSADYGKHVILTADINLPDGKIFGKAVIAPDTDATTPDYQGTPFSGVFDANSHTISHLTIRGASYVGLFGRLASEAEVKSLSVVDVNASASGDYVGALVGYNDGNMVRCYSSGAVKGGANVGGLVGANSGQATECYSTCAVTGQDGTGGFTGDNNGGRIVNSYSWGSVAGKEIVGGFAGYNAGGTILNCYSRGPVDGNSVIISCGASDCGYCSDYTLYPGGFVGGNRSCSCESYYWFGIWCAYSRCICDYGTIENCFWDTKASGQQRSDGGTGKTTDQMMSSGTYASWNLVDIWELPRNNYPKLLWRKPAPKVIYIGDANDLLRMASNREGWADTYILSRDIDLSGTRVTPIACFTGVFDGNDHTISHLDVNLPSLDKVGMFATLDFKGVVINLRLEAVNVHGRNNVGALVGYSYRGTTISNCYVDGFVWGTKDSVGGLVGCNEGTVKTSISAASVAGDRYVGGLVGKNDGSVSACGSSGDVGGGGDYVGGLVGDNSGSLTGSRSKSNVVGGDYVGGLVGRNYSQSTVYDCYSTGEVKGGNCVGGLAGSNRYTIKRCYAAGRVQGSGSVEGLVGSNSGSVLNSLWNKETSGHPNGTSGTGKTTAELRTMSTYVKEHWDIVDKKTSDVEGTWWILEGQDYPRLWWEPVEQ